MIRKLSEPGEIAFKSKDKTCQYKVFLLAKQDILVNYHDKIQGSGPAVVVLTESPTHTTVIEYDVDSPQVWAWISRVMACGLAHNLVTSSIDDHTAPMNRPRPTKGKGVKKT